MLKCSGEVSSGQWAVGSAGQWRSRRTVLVLLLTAHCLLLTVSCRRDMQDQPKAKPYRSSSFFKDGLSSRPLVEGTVARGWLRTDAEFYTGKKSKAPGTAASPGMQSAPMSGTGIPGTTAAQTAAAAY